MKTILLAATMLAVPALAFAQTDAGGGAMTTSMAELHATVGQFICNENPYTDQINTTTKESTGDMQVAREPVAQVLADHYGKPYSVGGKEFVVRKVVAIPYTFDVFRDGKKIGTRTENVLVLYAGGEGPG